MPRHYPPDTTPFSSYEEYLEHQRRLEELRAEERALTEQYRALKESDPEGAERIMSALQKLARHERDLDREYGDRLPLRLYARCPFCGDPLHWKIDLYSLADEWWTWPFVPREYKVPTCEHVLCVDGALNLEGHTPTEITGGEKNRIRMASEVPFVKPRMLELGNVVAVVHRMPEKIAGKYTGYPIVYFGDPRPPLSQGSPGWARTEFHDERGMWNIIYDVQDYALDKWIAAGKLCWLDPHAPHPLVCGPSEAYPFHGLSGLQVPYVIQDGKVWPHSPPKGGHGYP
jgi:hypothetical protein